MQTAAPMSPPGRPKGEYRSAQHEGAPVHPLVVRFGAFGDMVMTIPMAKALAQRFGRPCDVVSSGPWTEPLLSRVPEVGRVMLLSSRKAPYLLNRSQRDLVRWLRQRPPGPVYLVETDEKSYWLLKKAGITPDWICALSDLRRLPGEHATAHQLRQAAMTPAALAASHPLAGVSPAPESRPTLTDADRADCQAWLAGHGLADAPLVLFQPGNKKTMRRGLRRRASNVKWWPEERWAQVMAGVHETLPTAKLLICGSPAERGLAEDIRARCSFDGVFIATDELPIPRLLALQARAHSMVSIDTGPAHSAAAMGCPVVVLFARLEAMASSVPISTGAPVLILGPDSPAHDASMLSIDAGPVLAAWRGMVAGSGRAGPPSA